MTAPQAAEAQSRCELLRSLHRPGDPLLLPNAWDVATARAVVAAGFPVVATTSGGVAATLGYEDHEGAPADEMLAAAARIVRGVDVPVTVDAEAGYGMEPADVVAALRTMGAAGCNLEDSDYAAGSLRDPDRHAEWLAAVRRAAAESLLLRGRWGIATLKKAARYHADRFARDMAGQVLLEGGIVGVDEVPHLKATA